VLGVVCCRRLAVIFLKGAIDFALAFIENCQQLFQTLGRTVLALNAIHVVLLDRVHSNRVLGFFAMHFCHSLSFGSNDLFGSDELVENGAQCSVWQIGIASFMAIPRCILPRLHTFRENLPTLWCGIGNLGKR